MTDLNPALIEARLVDAVQSIQEGTEYLMQALAAYRKARRVFDQAFARAYFRADGTPEDRRWRAIIDTSEQRTLLDVAEVAYKHADADQHALELTLSAYQSVNKSVMAAYQAG